MGLQKSEGIKMSFVKSCPDNYIWFVRILWFIIGYSSAKLNSYLNKEAN